MRRHNTVIWIGFGKWRVCLYSQRNLQISPKQKSRKLATETYKVCQHELWRNYSNQKIIIIISDMFPKLTIRRWILCIVLIASLSQDPKLGIFCQTNSTILKVLKLSKTELKIGRLISVLVEFLRFTSAMLISFEKMPGLSLSKVLRFHVFFGYFIISFYLALFDFNLLFMTLVSTLDSLSMRALAKC